MILRNRQTRNTYNNKNDNSMEFNFYFNFLWNFNNFGNSAWYIEKI